MYVQNYINPVAERSLLYGDKSIGIVFKTPEEYENDNKIGVFIPRLMFGLVNTKGPYEQDVEFGSALKPKLLNSKHKSITTKSSIKTRNYVELYIAQIGNNVPPKLVLGENVFVDCCDKDIKNMYVLPFSLGEQKRRKDDRYTILCPNLKEFGEAATLNLENTYGMQIDTKEKIISIWTTCEGGGETSDKEKGKYRVSLNPAGGTITIDDNGKRTFVMNTDDDSWTMKNKAGCQFDMTGDTINMYAPNIINIEAKEEINIKSTKLNREHEDITTKASTDKEETKKLEITGDTLKSDYSTTEVKSDTYTNTTTKWKTDSPISGFTKILTADTFSIYSDAGEMPQFTKATLNGSGVFSNGLIPPMPVADATNLIAVLTAMCGFIDSALTRGPIPLPPLCTASVAAQLANIPSKTNMN